MENKEEVKLYFRMVPLSRGNEMYGCAKLLQSSTRMWRNLPFVKENVKDEQCASQSGLLSRPLPTASLAPNHLSELGLHAVALERLVLVFPAKKIIISWGLPWGLIFFLVGASHIAISEKCVHCLWPALRTRPGPCFSSPFYLVLAQAWSAVGA